jgi:DNA polymerase/3'-5' exonuclease PolX
MEEHKKKILSVIKGTDAIIVGSYRRGLETSGDIDVLIKAPESYSKKQIKEFFESLVKEFQNEG